MAAVKRENMHMRNRWQQMISISAPIRYLQINKYLLKTKYQAEVKSLR